MKNNLTCELVQDLLPSYIDGLTSDVTNVAVREHISHCDKCKTTLENMSQPCNEEKIIYEKKEIDFLKKARKKNIRVIVSSLVSVVLVIAIVFSSLPYLIKYDFDDSMVLCNLTVEGDTFNINATADHKYAKITDVNYTLGDSGILDISFKGREKTSLDNRTLFTWSYSSDKVKSVIHQGKILWEDGEYISPITSAVYKCRTPYIGDMSHNSVIASQLGIGEHIGSFENRLTTVQEPYGWELIFRDYIMLKQLPEKERLMKGYACVLLGIIGNLSEVKFTYTVLDYKGEKAEYDLTVTKEQATELLGRNIKKCSEDVNILQSLMEKTGLADMAYINPDNMESFEAEINEKAEIRLFNASTSQIKRIELQCKETENFGARDFEDDSIFNIGKRPVHTLVDLDLDLDNLSDNAYDEKRLGNVNVEVTVYDWDGNEYTVEDKITVSAFRGAFYDYILTGNFEKGFNIIQQ